MRESIHKLYKQEDYCYFLTILELLRQWQEDAKTGVNDVDTNGLCIYIAKNSKSDRRGRAILIFDSLLFETTSTAIFPFGGFMTYSTERRTKTCHHNPQRIAWAQTAIDSILTYLKEPI